MEKKVYLLPKENWHRLEQPYLRAFGELESLPGPENVACLVTEIDGEIEGFLFVGPVVHMEPGASLHPLVSMNEMRQRLEHEFALDYYVCYTSDSRYDAAMAAAGFEPVGVMWRKTV